MAKEYLSIKDKIVALMFAWAMSIPAIAQNINGEEVIVGAESITVINFPDEVLNIDFSDQEAYDYYTPTRRELKSLSLRFNKEKKTAPNTSLLVNEGGRSHMFKVVFDPTYNINDNSRPPLWYDHSNLKQLKNFVKEQNDLRKMNNEQMAQKKETDQQKRRKEQEESYALSEKKRAEALQKKEKEALTINNDERKKLSEQEKEIEQLKTLLDQNKKALAENQQAHDQLLRQSDNSTWEDTSKNQKKGSADNESEKKMVAQAKEEALRKQLQQERIKKEQEKVEAQQRLAEIEAARQKQENEKKYTAAGLWQRYGSKGINVFDIPHDQVRYLNTDFYLEKDTLLHYEEAQHILDTDKQNRLHLKGEGDINNAVHIEVEGITFKGAHAYFKIKIDNQSTDDFLTGTTYMHWYDENDAPKMMVTCSYLTYIGLFPLVRPSTQQEIVFVTRTPNVSDKESLVLFIAERRKEKGTAAVVIPGTVYNQELNRLATPLGKKVADKYDDDNKHTDKKRKKSKQGNE